LGNKSTENSGPVQVMGGADKTSIDLGSRYSCSASGSALWCWGQNDVGQIGDGSVYTSTGTSSSVNVGNFGQFSLGLAKTTCAIGIDGKTYCWGANQAGQIGDGTTVQRNSPTQVQGLAGSALSVSSGGYADATAGSQTCAVLSSGAVQCWGYNNYGQVGNGNTTNQTAPSTVTFNS
jgi:alpha-tubulin suppressor-like RCC1 family protein